MQSDFGKLRLPQPLMRSVRVLMARKQVITLKSTTKFSIVSTLVLGAVIVLSNQINQIAIMKSAALAYMVASLVFSVSVFMLLLRHYKIASNHDILMRLIAIVGAVFCCSIWVVLIYPMVMLLT